jgi:hypothetical protein
MSRRLLAIAAADHPGDAEIRPLRLLVHLKQSGRKVTLTG